MGNKDVVYDPADPTDAKIEAVEKLLGNDELSVDALAKRPETIQLLLQQQLIQLLEMKSTKVELSELKKVYENLKDERSGLRTEVAVLKERETVTLMEIPISIVSGFAINLLTTNISNLTGWLLLILSLTLLVFIRRGQISKLLEKNSHRRNVNETEN